MKGSSSPEKMIVIEEDENLVNLIGSNSYKKIQRRIDIKDKVSNFSNRDYISSLERRESTAATTRKRAKKRT
jgi:hypothetical protein